MNDHNRFPRKLNPNFKSLKLLNRPLKNKSNPQEGLEFKQNLDSNLSKRQINQNKNILKSKQKQNETHSQENNVKPPPSEIGTFNPNQIFTNSTIPEALLAEAIKNNRVKLPGYLDIPSRLSKNLDKGIPGITPGVSTDAGRIHDNLDRLKNEFCRFIDFKYHASTIGNTDLEQRFFLRNCFERLKEIDYPTIKMRKWNEYQNMLLEQKKNLLLFQKSRGGDQPLDDAWCQTDEYFFNEFVNENIKLKFEKLKEIKMKRLDLKKRLYLKGYFDITDFDDIEQIYDDKMLSTLGLDNKFIDDSSEEELDDLMNYVEKIDSNGRIEYNNYQIKQILSVYDRKFRRKCKPDYYQFFFGNLDYKKEKQEKNKNLININEVEKIPKELKLKLVEFLDKKLNWTDIETPWEWEHDFEINEMHNIRRDLANPRLNEMDSHLLEKNIPNTFLKELTEIKKEYKRELLDNALKIYEMKGVSNEIRNRFSTGKEYVKNKIYLNKGNEEFSELVKNDILRKDKTRNRKIELESNNYFSKINEINFRRKTEIHDLVNQDSSSEYNIDEEELFYKLNPVFNDNFRFNSNDNSENEKKEIQHNSDEIMFNLSKLILSKGINDELRKDLIRHLNRMSQKETKMNVNNELCKINKESILSENMIENNARIFTDESNLNLSEQLKNVSKINNSKNFAKSKIHNVNLSKKDYLSSTNSLNKKYYTYLNKGSDIDINHIEAQLGVLRNAAGILDVLRELEQESNMTSNREKLKNLIIQKTNQQKLDLDESEMKTVEESVEVIISEILERKKFEEQGSKSDPKMNPKDYKDYITEQGEKSRNDSKFN